MRKTVKIKLAIEEGMAHFKMNDEKGSNINYFLPKDKIMKKIADIAGQISEKNKKSLYLLKNSRRFVIFFLYLETKLFFQKKKAVLAANKKNGYKL